jgi:hypothetical protein
LPIVKHLRRWLWMIAATLAAMALALFIVYEEFVRPFQHGL